MRKLLVRILLTYLAVFEEHSILTSITCHMASPCSTGEFPAPLHLHQKTSRGKKPTNVKFDSSLGSSGDLLFPRLAGYVSRKAQGQESECASPNRPVTSPELAKQTFSRTSAILRPLPTSLKFFPAADGTSSSFLQLLLLLLCTSSF